MTPLLRIYFLLCAEVLSLMLKQNKDIKGVKIGDVEHILPQFADDTTVLNNHWQQLLKP